jgi:hypothetical protein
MLISAHLERLTHKGVLRKLIHRGGLRADILAAGNITVGGTIKASNDTMSTLRDRRSDCHAGFLSSRIHTAMTQIQKSA